MRTLRILPSHVVTGDMIEVDFTDGNGAIVTVWDVVTRTDPSGKLRWLLGTVRGGGPASYGRQSRVTVRRSGPPGPGEPGRA